MPGTRHYDMLRNVSRTFALSIEQLPVPLRDIVTVAYLLFRVADCIEDHAGLLPERKAFLLRQWADVLQGRRDAGGFVEEMSGLEPRDDPEIEVARRADVVASGLRELAQEPRAILTRHVCDTSVGMARWQEHGPFVEDEAAMDDYMHEVAGRVGYLLTDVFAWCDPAIASRKDRLMQLGREFGLALQTVNIIRGMRKDYERGWVFVPRELYEAHGLTRDSLFAPENHDRAMRVVARLADKAERHLRDGLAYITMLPAGSRRIRLFCIWPLLFAVRTLALSRNNPAVIASEAKITRPQVRRIVTVSSLIWWSNRLLGFYYRLLSAPRRV
jgi:farnesyl-diphosphate farnesyltransferase